MTFVVITRKDTLSDFDANVFFGTTLMSCSSGQGVFGRQLYLKYSFFYTFFLGRYISSRPELVSAFIADEEYLRMMGVVDVITGLSAENSRAIVQQLDKLHNIGCFATKYEKRD